MAFSSQHRVLEELALLKRPVDGLAHTRCDDPPLLFGGARALTVVLGREAEEGAKIGGLDRQHISSQRIRSRTGCQKRRLSNGSALAGFLPIGRFPSPHGSSARRARLRGHRSMRRRASPRLRRVVSDVSRRCSIRPGRRLASSLAGGHRHVRSGLVSGGVRRGPKAPPMSAHGRSRPPPLSCPG